MKKKKFHCNLGENLEEMPKKKRKKKLFGIAPYKRRSLLL